MYKLPLIFAALSLMGASAARAQDTTNAPAQASAPVPPATLVPIDGVIAIVGDQPILHSEIQEQLATLSAQGQKLPTDSAGQAQLVHQILSTLIDAELLTQRAKVEKVEVNDNEITGDVDQQMSKIRGRFSTETEFRSQLKAAGFGTPEEYRRWLIDQRRRMLMQQKLFEKLRQSGKLAPAPVSEAEVDSFFQANKGEIQHLPATVTYRQIVITPKPSAKEDSLARAKAEEILNEIKRGGDFAQIAKRESMDSSTRELGGDLGWNRRGMFVPEFDRMYFALPPGQLSSIIKTTYGYHIIKIDRVQPAEVKGRHILIRQSIDSADIVASRRLADSVATLWRKGANYDSLVAKYHDPGEEKLMPEPFPQDSLPKEYQMAIKEHKAKDVLNPFSIQDRTRNAPKFFILELTSVNNEREPTLSDYRQQIRDQLAQQKGVHRYLENLRKQTYVAIFN